MGRMGDLIDESLVADQIGVKVGFCAVAVKAFAAIAQIAQAHIEPGIAAGAARHPVTALAGGDIASGGASMVDKACPGEAKIFISGERMQVEGWTIQMTGQAARYTATSQ